MFKISKLLSTSMVRRAIIWPCLEIGVLLSLTTINRPAFSGANTTVRWPSMNYYGGEQKKAPVGATSQDPRQYSFYIQPLQKHNLPAVSS